jgi:hypothetical protein
VTLEEVTQRLQAGGLKLSFDTNALFSERRLFALCNDVARWNERLKLARREPVQLAVCAAAHAEKLFDLKQQYRDKFDMGSILGVLRSKGLVIEPINESHALELATRLGEDYPDTAAWRAAKRRRCFECLGLNPKTTHADGSGSRCGATIDWFIGAHARAEKSILVSDDEGWEFKGVSERVRLDVLAEAIQQLVGNPL